MSQFTRLTDRQTDVQIADDSKTVRKNEVGIKECEVIWQQTSAYVGIAVSARHCPVFHVSIILQCLDAHITRRNALNNSCAWYTAECIFAIIGRHNPPYID